MAYCPHCSVRYDETNETQPCCHECGHPISCGCGGGHSHTPPSPSVPPSVLDDVTDNDASDDENESDGEGDEDTYTPEDNLPF